MCIFCSTFARFFGALAFGLIAKKEKLTINY